MLINKKSTVAICLLTLQLNIGFAENISLDYKHPRYESFAREKLVKITDFSVNNLSNLAGHKSVFYPFGGPDIIYPILMFPHATSYTLIGLERVGKNSQDLSNINRNELDKTLDSLLKKSFTVTSDMWKDISAQGGVLPIFIAQLNMLGCQVKNFKYLDFDPKGAIEIEFTYQDIDRKLIYLKANIQNENIKNDLLEFIKDNNLIDICMLKAGSYSLHRKEFSKMRDFLLANANVFLQDDTGIPINMLSRDFNIELFGNYTVPYGKEWKCYSQPALQKMYKTTGSKQSISFCYGYGCGKIMPSIILATKK